MRPRYYKQRDQFRCGQLAVFNALKWAGGFKGVTAKQALPRLDALCECVKPLGTPHRALDRTLRSVGRDFFDVRRVYRPKLKEIEKHLRAGGAIIINFRWKDLRGGEIVDARHYVLVTDMSTSGNTSGWSTTSLSCPCIIGFTEIPLRVTFFAFASLPSKDGSSPEHRNIRT